MEAQQQLSVINFGDLNVQVYGTQDEPLIKCSDLIIHVLGYKDCSKACWFKELRRDSFYVTPQFHGGVQFFTEQGVYKALMKSNRPIAEQFQRRLCEFLKQVRQQRIAQMTQLQIESDRLREEIKQLTAPRQCTVYKIYQGDQLLYIGKDASLNQQRVNQHFAQRNKILQAGYQQIDIHLATLKLQDVRVETIYCDDSDVNTIEQLLIEEQNPPYNQTFNEQNRFTCQQCDREYKYRASYEKHMLTHN